MSYLDARQRRPIDVRSVFNSWDGGGGFFESDSDGEAPPTRPSSTPLFSRVSSSPAPTRAPESLEEARRESASIAPTAISTKSRVSAGVGPASMMTPNAKARHSKIRKTLSALPEVPFSPSPKGRGLVLTAAAPVTPAPVPKPPTGPLPKLQPLQGHDGFFISQYGRVYRFSGKKPKMTKDPRKLIGANE